MQNSTKKRSTNPEVLIQDPLTNLLRQGAKKLVIQAVEAELATMLSQYQDMKLLDGRQAVVRNGYLPERTIQTGVGDIEVKVPKVRDRSHSGIRFHSGLLPPYLRRTKSIETLLPWLYLKGISTGDFSEALVSLLGPNAPGLSANTIGRLKSHWTEEHQAWEKRDLHQKEYIYFWADGVYSQVRMDDKLCLLVIIGVTPDGHKELVAVRDGFRESTASWVELLTELKLRGLNIAPKLAVGDGALGFWNALAQVYPTCRGQRCWVHKTANVLNKLPKAMQEKAKLDLQQIWLAPSRQEAHQAFDRTLVLYQTKYPQAMKCLGKDREALLAFYDFPAEHWAHLRTTNPIESTFATVKLRTGKTRNCGSRQTTLAMAYKLLESAQKHWRKICGASLLPLVANDTVFIDGEISKLPSERSAA